MGVPDRGSAVAATHESSAASGFDLLELDVGRGSAVLQIIGEIIGVEPYTYTDMTIAYRSETGVSLNGGRGWEGREGVCGNKML